MTVEQQGAPVPVKKSRKLFFDRAMERPMHLIEPILQVLRSDRLPPQRPVTGRPAWNDAEPSTGPWAQGRNRSRADDGGVDFVLGAVAVDGPARSAGDDRGETMFDRWGDELVDERVLERMERPVAALAECDQPVGIVSSGMGNGQEHGNIGARRVDVRRGERHGKQMLLAVGTKPRIVAFRVNTLPSRWKILNVPSISRSMAKILLAEDDTSMREYLQRALQRVGYEVAAVGCGTEAMPLLETERYDLLLTDIVMPEMDGIELAQKASAIDPEIRVMFITGFAAVALQGGRTTPGAKLLSKPFHLKDLVAEVDRIFQTEDQHGRL